MIDQQMPHGPRSYRKEVLAILPLAFARAHQLEISLVHQGRSLQ